MSVIYLVTSVICYSLLSFKEVKEKTNHTFMVFIKCFDIKNNIAFIDIIWTKKTTDLTFGRDLYATLFKWIILCLECPKACMVISYILLLYIYNTWKLKFSKYACLPFKCLDMSVKQYGCTNNVTTPSLATIKWLFNIIWQEQ